MIVCDRCKKPFPALADVPSNIEPANLRLVCGAAKNWSDTAVVLHEWRLHCCAGCRELLRLALGEFVEDFSIADRGWLPELDAAPVAEAAPELDAKGAEG